MGSLNSVTLVGNLGNPPELRQTTTGKAVANFSVATSNVFTNGEGEKKEETAWHRVVVWGQLAETCSKYLEKGSTVAVQGRLAYREWKDKEGKDQHGTEIVAEDVQFLSSRSAKKEG